MRLCLNTSALNRPFDDLSAPRVRIEAEAVAALLGAVEAGQATLMSSEYLEFEIGQDPDPERAHRVRTLLGGAKISIALSARVVTRARELERFGLRGLDALHVAAAEAGAADALVTTDDRMVNAARRAGEGLKVQVIRPGMALERLIEADE